MQKILVIDDSRMIRMRVRDMLPSGNVQIIEARDGKEGLDLIHSERPQLIILDFLLPKKSGWEVYQDIQNTPDLQAIPLVLMSGRKEEVTEKISEPFEHFAFVEKPFEQEQLVKAIKEARGKATRKAKATAPEEAAASSQGGEDVASLKAEVAQLKEQVQTMQGQIDQLRKQMNQLVNFIKKKVG
ncbi:response regulator receiver protein [Halothece sp. PCC 7418]|uniref:response regulator n=1 Tax=Halothece sp. (strain PCC 7418) TaxID=65093 RepID=UPI0002A05C29|nr:response regulator [Halothece sp. PCC 7418]AFZ43105.1 response regulator receiver protein [Halothece sp. PCC 7418]